MALPLDWKGKAINAGPISIVGSVLVLQPNSERKGAIISNGGPTIKWVCLSDNAAVNTGIPIIQNGSYEINLTNPWYGAVSVACAVAAEVIGVMENE